MPADVVGRQAAAFHSLAGATQVNFTTSFGSAPRPTIGAESISVEPYCGVSRSDEERFSLAMAAFSGGFQEL
ncbi:hypothetical protein CO666_20010 [Rhizobium chutanense]|uniref:Uncharacterized protein n=1 Tax=Rhizobium chutanense TaxID=2035448 RepID=A0A2A6J9L9_9HYPH|nr:hypothetical protein CO666_20010 [Rhizobium chutanense]